MTRRLDLDTTEDQASDWFAMPALALAGALWGVSFLFGKWALEELGPAHVTLLRFSLASAALLPYALLKGVLPGRGDLPLFLLVGFLTVPATFLVQFWGLSLTGATVAALIVGCGPPIVALFASLFLGERLGKTGWSAVGASTLGVALAVAQPGVSNDWLGDALVLLSLLAVVGWVLLGKRLGDGYPAVPATAWILTFGTLTLVPEALLWEGVPRLDLTLLGWASVLVLGLGCSAVTYALWNWGVARVPASRAGVFLNLEPLVGALLGVLVLGEAWGPGTVVGGALIIGAALVVSRRSSV
ncbi:MAG: putative permease [Rubrobacteraceae bacterium]|nr:putative permease [Rubrobacteraceae bacterium]